MPIRYNRKGNIYLNTIPIDKFMPISQSKFTSFPTNDTVLEYDSSEEK